MICVSDERYVCNPLTYKIPSSSHCSNYFCDFKKLGPKMWLAIASFLRRTQWNLLWRGKIVLITKLDNNNDLIVCGNGWLETFSPLLSFIKSFPLSMGMHGLAVEFCRILTNTQNQKISQACLDVICLLGLLQFDFLRVFNWLVLCHCQGSNGWVWGGLLVPIILELATSPSFNL